MVVVVVVVVVDVVVDHFHVLYYPLSERKVVVKNVVVNNWKIVVKNAN